MSHLSQFYFDLPERSIRNNINKVILVNQKRKDFDKNYRDVGG